MESQQQATEIYEPLNAYKDDFKARHQQNTEDYFDGLLKTSGVDVEANRETSRNIRQLTVQSGHAAAQIKRYGAFRVALILATLLGALFAYNGIMALAHAGFDATALLVVVAGIVVPFFAIRTIIKTINPKLRDAQSLKSDLDRQIEGLTAAAWAQLRPLNDLFVEGMHVALFEKTLPNIHFERMFEQKKLDHLVEKFGHQVGDDPDRSTLHVRAGDINGNPFYIANDRVHQLGTMTYHGSLTIYWTTTERQGEEMVERSHSQTLYASVEKPCPYFDAQPYLVYANEAAPDLVFSRGNSNADKLSQKQIDKKVDKDIKKLNKLSEKGISKGGNFTVLGNSEFEVLFGATDRNHEVQFRLLFTPLAQKQMLQIMKEKEAGFGDNFRFHKRGMINVLEPSHLAAIDMDPPAAYFRDFDIDAARARFIDYQNAFFRHLYFAFAPILAIPLYQQQKPREAIYGEAPARLSHLEHESIVNRIDQDVLRHPQSATRNILKTEVLGSGESHDTIRVTAKGYRTEDRRDFVTKFGGDGSFHEVPVDWTEYIPVAKSTDVKVHIAREGEQGIQAVNERLKNAPGAQEDFHRIGAYVAQIVT